MSSKTPKRKSQQIASMENGNHENLSSETNGSSESQDLKGFTQNELTNAKAVIKDVTVVLTHAPEITEQKHSDEETEKRVTRSQNKENGGKEEVADTEDTEKRVTRSQTKDTNEEEEEEEVIDVGEEEDNVVEIQINDVEVKETTLRENGEKDASDVEKDTEPDETEPELQFDENSDNSGKNSPASRCLTRRSHLRNLPTPKSPSVNTPTPSPEDQEETKTDLNLGREFLVISDDLSIRAEPGNDTTRANFTVDDEDLQEPSEFFKSLKDKSLSQTLRGLSSRRSISLRHAHITRSEFNVPYPKRASVESISGIKRKQRSPSPEDNKRTKREGGGLLSYIRSPVFGVRHHFNKDLTSSTPKLTGFRNKNSLLDGEEIDKIKLEVEDAQPEKKWCSIM